MAVAADPIVGLDIDDGCRRERHLRVSFGQGKCCFELCVPIHAIDTSQTIPFSKSTATTSRYVFPPREPSMLPQPRPFRDWGNSHSGVSSHLGPEAFVRPGRGRFDCAQDGDDCPTRAKRIRGAQVTARWASERMAIPVRPHAGS